MMLFYGAAALLCQSALLRELAVLFQNNELVIGILFFCWFIGGAAGTTSLRFIPRKGADAQE